MDKITVIIKDQEENESIVVAQLNDLEDQDIPFFKRVEHIEVEGNIIFPNIDLLFESDIDGKIYKLVAPVNDKRFIWPQSSIFNTIKKTHLWDSNKWALFESNKSDLNQVAMSLNTRPRKALDWLTPLEKFAQLIDYHKDFETVAPHVWIRLVLCDLNELG